MRKKSILFICLLKHLHFYQSARNRCIDTSMFEKNFQTIWLARLNGWIFHDGNDLKWIANNVDTTGWKRLSPTAISMKDADKNGRAEGWYRLQFKLIAVFKCASLHFTLRDGWQWIFTLMAGT